MYKKNVMQKFRFSDQLIICDLNQVLYLYYSQKTYGGRSEKQFSAFLQYSFIADNSSVK